MKNVEIKQKLSKNGRASAVVKEGGLRCGELYVTREGLEWRPTRHQYVKFTPWDEFIKWMEQKDVL